MSRRLLLAFSQRQGREKNVRGESRKFSIGSSTGQNDKRKSRVKALSGPLLRLQQQQRSKKRRKRGRSSARGWD